MAYRTRIEIEGGTYYVAKRMPVPFATPADYARFQSRFGLAVRRRRVRVFGFCWLRDSIHFAVQVRDVSLHRLMSSLPRAASNGEDRPTRVRYRALLIDPDAYLAELVCYLHWLPVLSGAIVTPDDYAWSGHGAYLGLQRLRWLDTSRVKDYRERISLRPSAERVREFEHGSACDPCILGDAAFIRTLPWRFRPHRTTQTLPEIAARVAAVLEVELEQVRSKSRAHDLVLARALIAHLATSRKVATWREVGAYLNHAYPMLHALTQRYREEDPELFTTWAVRSSGLMLKQTTRPP